MRTGLQLVAVRSRRGPRLVADRSPTSRRLIADQSPTSFNDSHAPILTKLVGDRSATSRRLIGDWSATSPGPVCDQISRSQVFVQAQKPGCDWFGRNEVPDQSPTSLQPRRDRSGTLLRPLRSVKIVSRGEVAERLQCMSDWGLNESLFEMLSIHIYTHCDTFLCKQTTRVSHVNGKSNRGYEREVQAVLDNIKNWFFKCPCFG